MAALYDCSVPSELLTGMRLARAAIGRGALVVIPTDTVYGIAADAFNPTAVQALLDAKGRTRSSPPPVLVPGVATLDALAETVSQPVRDLVDAFWPGGLTIIVPARSSLAWDLGETRGTVALRQPSDPIALELLTEVGPLAVSSANLTGEPAATTASLALESLGDSVDVYLDGGATETVTSTIVDASTFGVDGAIRIVRHGAVSEEQLRSILGDVLVVPDEQPNG
ncbi:MULTISPECIES: L-threonylcarbamoyladenylate synthase [unclassified Agreia]|uniref:L-threonylcarbamoyladenylate synthase n=1 Tax=unclassified Agreia TaxID=2641148 RepID=UPI0006F63713|nr:MULTISPECIES: L-threonylcarbamoyladenylate synthase [Microbacteriaceae]KQM58254.1 translation factor SUA5 [Agreia sp. Leaf210]KQR22244.1 translation factor SUA5 [Agreia sp. Leaf335]PPF61039.1 threonylcarbamoyl-AMP synthase [Clavibacter michiganensis]